MDLLLAAIRLVAALTGAFRPGGEATESQLKVVRELLARCLFLGQAEPFFGNEDPLQDIAELEAQELSDIREVCTSVQADLQSQPDQTLDVRVFRREVPVTTEMPEACPAWAAGAAVSQSFGPFLSPDHRPVWFTTYRIRPLVSLIGQSGGAPLLFLPHVDGLQPATDFSFPSGSVWIFAPLLAAEAPADGYCGLRVSGVNLQLDTLPVTSTGIIRVAAGTKMRLQVKLKAPEHSVDDAHGSLHPGSIQAKYPIELRLVISAATPGRAWPPDVTWLKLPNLSS